MPEPTRAEEHEALIAESWKRCRETYGLLDRSPRPLPAPRPDEAAVRLERLRDESHRIFTEIARAASIVRRTGGMLVLTDADRIVVNVIRNPADTICADEPIALGSCWHERVAGTNGVHMGLLCGRAFTVRGVDHYHRSLNAFACTSMPIFDADGEPIASLTYSAFDSGRADDYRFAEQLVGAATRGVQRALFMDRHRHRRVLELAPGRDDTAGPALLAIESDGAIVGCTAEAARRLAVEDGARLVGGALSDVLDVSLRHLDAKVLEGRVATVDGREIVVASVPRESDATPPRRGTTTVIDRRRQPALERLAVGNPALARQLRRSARVLRHGVPLHVTGPTGSGKSTALAALVGELGSVGRVLSVNAVSPESGKVWLNPRATERLYARSCLEGLPLQTLVIENVDELAPETQAVLLDLMERLERVAGSTHTAPARNLRVVTSSSRSLAGDATLGFRRDLASHLCATTLALPPLRERPDRRHLLEAIATRIAGQAVRITDAAWTALEAHPWTGNLREARSVMHEAVLCGNGSTITPVDLPDGLRLSARRSDAHGPEGYDERRRVADALDTTNWNVSGAARRLGMGRATLNRKIAKLGLTRPGSGPST